MERITSDPSCMRGLPCIRETRVTVSAVLGQLAAGQTFEQLLSDYPYLEKQDILAALEFAAQSRDQPWRGRPGPMTTEAERFWTLPSSPRPRSAEALASRASSDRGAAIKIEVGRISESTE